MKTQIIVCSGGIEKKYMVDTPIDTLIYNWEHAENLLIMRDGLYACIQKKNVSLIEFRTLGGEIE